MASPHIKILLLLAALTPATAFPSFISSKNISRGFDISSTGTRGLINVLQKSPGSISAPNEEQSSVVPQDQDDAPQVPVSDPSILEDSSADVTNEQTGESEDESNDDSVPVPNAQAHTPDGALEGGGNSTDAPPQIDGNRSSSRNTSLEAHPAPPPPPLPTVPIAHNERTGIWTTLNCSMPAVRNTLEDPATRWLELDTPRAFQDIVDIWKNYDRGKVDFLASVVNTTAGIEERDCGRISGGGCSAMTDCQHYEHQEGTGPAAFLIHNSFVNIHNVSLHLINY